VAIGTPGYKILRGPISFQNIDIFGESCERFAPGYFSAFRRGQWDPVNIQQFMSDHFGHIRTVPRDAPGIFQNIGCGHQFPVS